MTRNISYILTILWNPNPFKCGLAGPKRGLSLLCWLSFLVLFLAPMVHFRVFRFLTSPLHNQTIKQHSKCTHALASYTETSFPLPPGSNECLLQVRDGTLANMKSRKNHQNVLNSS